AIAIFLCYFLFKRYKNKWLRVLIVLCGVVYVGLVCLSRMYLGKHYLTDLLMGIVISAVFCTLGILFMNYVKKKKEIYKSENKNGN
ncbi:MAG: phosphatase PAP2 family protein, partial [Clostridia bacterium]|nr:phosphatase PAP2 family protein [Clostridia bacterium]